MEMAVVDAVVPFLLDNITRLLQNEVGLLSGVKDKVVLLQKKLHIINGFLRDTEGKRTNHEVKALIDRITDDAYEAQDVIEDYVVRKENHYRRYFLCKLFHSVDYAQMLHYVDNKINELNKSIDDIYANRDKYGIQQGQSAEVISKPDQQLQKLRTKVAEDDDVVGFDNHAEYVIEMLIGGGPQRDVVSLIGMGGSGKTTLARKVYKDPRVKNRFNSYAWVFVSEDFKPKDVLTTLLKSFKGIPEENAEANDEDQVDEEERHPKKMGKNKKEKDEVDKEVEKMKKSLRRKLKSSRYLIVLDDIWEIQAWTEIQDAFPDGKTGSRILITSREVPFYNNHFGPFRLLSLNEEDSWLLFLKKVFRGEDCPKELEKPARKMVDKCKGLPLSIVVLAGLLQYKDPSEWSTLNKDVLSKIAKDPVGRVKDILKLSYDHLPRTLKPCFVYLGIFPEDYEISARELIKLWIAEGLIEPSKDKSLEEVADEDYLKELINRNLLQMTRKRSDGGVKTCQLHDHIRELCIFEAKDNKFFEVCTHNDIDKMMGRPRRVSLHFSKNYYYAHLCHSLIRSLFVFGTNRKIGDLDARSVVKDSKVIRVLHIDGNFPFERFHKDIGNLIHLKYLKVDAPYLRRMENSISQLMNLETLEIWNSSLVSLPNKIWKLKRLRHLCIDGIYFDVPKLSKGQTSCYLQTLQFISLNPENVKLLEMGTFPNLKKLGFVHTFKGDRMTSLLERLQCLEHLRILKIVTPPSFAKGDKFPQNLTKITLEFYSSNYIALNEESMNALGNLPCLQILKLVVRKNPEKFEYFCIPAGFKQLQVLIMRGLGCQSWKFEQGAMPRLRRLVIKECEYLTQLPNELCSSTTLRQVEVCRKMAEILENLEDVKNICRVTIKD